jgi:hypothetical protein
MMTGFDSFNKIKPPLLSLSPPLASEGANITLKDSITIR